MKAFALAYPVHFLDKQQVTQAERIQYGANHRAELYQQYRSGVVELKNVLGDKSSWQWRGLSGSGRSVA